MTYSCARAPSRRALSFLSPIALAVALFGCGGSGHADHASATTSVPSSEGGGASPSGDDGATSLFGGDASVEGGLVGALAIAPSSPVVTVVVGQPLPTVQFTASVGSTPVAATWAIDRGELGTIDPNGLFTAGGSVGGVGNVFATYGGFQVKTTLTVVLEQTDNGDPAWSSKPSMPGAGGYGGVGGDGPGGAPTPAQMTAL
ncbi:MAG TPA: hypothetical protein VKU41_07740, partial [Polyangiaceae bacterium]|nr:hypothetical protein [Polyangiaceae bacterium]